MKQDVKNNSPLVTAKPASQQGGRAGAGQDALQHNRAHLASLRSEANKVFNQLTAEKKKTVFAVCLIALMVFMWVRVLGNKTPKAAEAALGQQLMTSDVSKSGPELKITFIELPEVAGRNNSITRDFFASDDWWKLIVSGEGGKIAGIEEVSISKGGSEEIAKWVAERLKLEAIGFGENPRAFINGKPLSVGGKLFVSDGDDKYECEVVGIEEDKVFIRCREAEITLKLKRVLEVTD